ncbi:hypothetical protein FS749_010832 [Ceratobasidium sp. UAMH 11750]|nr:hypothetical protein FS749_010832 [Ceratobasidium sp. UAMH 11750]
MEAHIKLNGSSPRHVNEVTKKDIVKTHGQRTAFELRVKPAQPSPGPSASNKKMMVADNKKATEDHQSKAYREAIIKAHSCTCLVSLFGFKQAQDAAHATPVYDDKGEPVWFKPGGRIAIPHLNRDFEENFAAWGPKFYGLIRDVSRMQDPEEKEYLLSVPREKFRDALPTGAFSSMLRAWKENRDGKGEEVRQKKNRNSRRGGRKKEKSKRRMQGLERSKLPVDKFAFVTDPEFQSSEHSDPDDKSHCTIVTRKCVAPEVSKLVDALDVEFESQKSRPGNPVYTRIDRDQTNTALKMSKGQKVPQWGITPGWMGANPALARTSRPFIDSQLESMPNADEVARFIQDHEPEEREYKRHNPAPEDTVPPFEPAPQTENPPIAPPAAQPFFQPVTRPTPAAAPGPSNQIPYCPSYAQQLVHYGLDQYALPFVQDAPYGLFPDDVTRCALPPPDYMLDGSDFNAATGLQVDASHPFLTDGATFDAIMAQVQDATAVNSAPQSDQAASFMPANGPPIPGPSDDPQVPNTEVTAPVVELAQPRSSGRHRRATAKAAEMAEAREPATPELPETTVLKPKLSKTRKRKMGMVKKGKVKGSVEGKMASKGEDQAPTPGTSCKPFNIGKIRRIKVKKLPGE